MLDSATFPYLPVSNNAGETTWRPILPVTLIHHATAVQAEGLIDTGADVNVLPYHVGIALGAIWEEQTRKNRTVGQSRQL